MEPDRIRAYLQVACAGLGFDIGEVWWTANEKGSSTVAAIEECSDGDGSFVNANSTKKKKKNYRFVQLYTSKCYESRRSELVNPPDAYTQPGMRRSNSLELEKNLQKHVLSPRLVEAICNTTQVVWANSKTQEGLIGRSDVRLQTAVGMPVAMDAQGNMCVVVMFSPNNVKSSDDALEYLQTISQSATSPKIPCLLPVFDPGSGIAKLPHAPHSVNTELVSHNASSLGEGVTARFVSLEDSSHGRERSSSFAAELSAGNQHGISTAPKDTFGIPMLPSFTELGSVTPQEDIDPFDEASYGIWTTIMDTVEEPGSLGQQSSVKDGDSDYPVIEGEKKSDPALQVVLSPGPSLLPGSRQVCLEEFCSAFIAMSVFDMADVWVQAGNVYPDCLRHVVTIKNEPTNDLLNQFRLASEKSLIKFWTGAVGRAHSCGNPVWSANSNVFIDEGRSEAFQRAQIKTVLAVPVFTSSSSLPACVVSFYSLVKSGSVPFVLRFVQQALRLIWDGLDTVEPHESVGVNKWKEVAPADLGVMAADVEMQQHFISKKRPHTAITETVLQNDSSFTDDTQKDRLSSRLESVNLPTGETVNVPLQLPGIASEIPTIAAPEINIGALQNHLAEAVRSVGTAVPFEHVATNAEGTKRAHVVAPATVSGNLPAPLPMPQPLPTHVVSGAVKINDTITAQVQPSKANQSMGINALSIAHQVLTGLPPDQVQNNSLNTNADCDQVVLPSPIGMPDASAPLCIPVLANGNAPMNLNMKPCRIQGCNNVAANKRPYCAKHSGNRFCEHPGCKKCAQGSTRFCIAHGGGRRCTFPGCDKGARDKFFCAAHGGGKRCKIDGCSKSAVGGSSLCTAHGGGRRCAIEGCDKSAQSSTKYCVKHGGGKKCAHEGCVRVARGRTLYCAAHGGGVRCKMEGCNRVAIGKMQLCRAHGGGTRGSKKNEKASSTGGNVY